jgi:PKD repeat protein
MVGGGPFSILSGTPFNLLGGGTTNIVVQFATASEGSFSNYVAITTDNGGNNTNGLTGSGAVVPVASFIGTPTSGAAPLTVSFTDSSTGTITNRFWDWGDGATTNTALVSLVHTYNVPGTNTVALTVMGPLGTNRLNVPGYIVVTNLGPIIITIAGLTNQVQLTWPLGTLQSADSVSGIYTDVTNAVSPYIVPVSSGVQFYRVHVR